MSSRPKFGFSYEAQPDSGLKVISVSPGSPAEKAGLKAGDIITSFNGVKMTGMESPREELAKQAELVDIGDTVSVEFRRGSEKRIVKMVAEELGPNAFAYSFSDDPAWKTEMRGMAELPKMFEMGMLPGRWMDMEMVSLNRDLGEYFGTPEGVLVVRAPKDSSLALRAGDVILSIDGRKPTTPPQALRILRSYDRGESFEIVVLRQKKKMTLTAKVPDQEPRGYFYENGTPEQEREKVQGDQ
jgi:S1-C subfamily serine protease